MSYFYEAYKKIKDFAKLHDLILVNGFYSNNDKKTDYIEEKTFLMEINKNYFVTLKFEKDYFIVICKRDILKNTTAFNRMENLTKTRREMLVIYEYDTDKKKLDSLIDIYYPVINCIPLQSFLIGPLNHSAAPDYIKPINYEEIEEIIMIKKKDLPEMSFKDPVSAWLRLKPGQVVKIVNRSPVCGGHPIYKLIN